MDGEVCSSRSAQKSSAFGLGTDSTVPVKRHRGEPGHTRDRHKEPHKPTSKPTPPTDSRARPHPNPGTHASPHTTPLTRKRGGGDGTEVLRDHRHPPLPRFVAKDLPCTVRVFIVGQTGYHFLERELGNLRMRLRHVMVSGAISGFAPPLANMYASGEEGRTRSAALDLQIRKQRVTRLKAQICQFSPLGPSRAARAEPHGLPGSATTHEPATAVKQHRGARRPKRRVYREVIP